MPWTWVREAEMISPLKKTINSAFTPIPSSENTHFLALSSKNYSANNSSLSEQKHLIPQSQTGNFSWSGWCSFATALWRICQSRFCCKNHPVTKQNIILWKKKKRKKEELSLLLSAVCLWVSFRAAFLLHSFRLESPTRTIKCGEMDTTFDLLSP